MSRPPLEDSNVTCTVLAAHGMPQHAAEAQRAEVEAAVAKAKAWLAEVKLVTQEDKVSRVGPVQCRQGGNDRMPSGERRRPTSCRTSDAASYRTCHGAKGRLVGR
jgi:hypothetical protein